MRSKVASSRIAAVGYDGRKQLLEIEFTSGKVYNYLTVPASIYRGLMQAESHGQYFNHFIRARYIYGVISD